MAITLGYIIVAFSADIVFGHRRRVPPGAEPRVAIEVDPSLKARNRFRTGVYLVRLGVAAGVVMAAAIAYVGNNPLSIGAQYGLTQATDDATALGANIGLGLAAIAVLAAIWVRAVPLVLIGVIDFALIGVVISPPLFNGQIAALGLTVFLMLIPLTLATIGTVFVFTHYNDAVKPREVEPAQAR
ncbi:MAG: hypothetical protein OXN15_05725 [Chloroflexota bacterium]|nr:hypothetical protein [Chloroflexota bacterium]MDE2968713.1 hypothetical protein [Chloroflexota bacterium]